MARISSASLFEDETGPRVECLHQSIAAALYKNTTKVRVVTKRQTEAEQSVKCNDASVTAAHLDMHSPGSVPQALSEA